MDDALVERVATAIIAAGYNSATAHDIARAALAIAEPAIRADEREACAEEAFNEYLAAENDVETAGHSNVVTRLQSEGAANAANRILQAIRARKGPRA